MAGNTIAITEGLSETSVEILCRIRDDRVFYSDPPKRPNRPKGTGGRPPRHGKRFKCGDPDILPEPDATLSTSDPNYGKVEVDAWHSLHPRLIGRGRWKGTPVPPIVKGTVIRVDVEHLPRPTARTKKTLWLFWSGQGEPDLDLMWRSYLRRFDIEHTFRFVKSTLAWTTPSLNTPEQADLWTWLVIAAYTQLRLARGILTDKRLPWERPLEPEKMTPIASTKRVSSTYCNDWNSSQSTENHPSRSWKTKGNPQTTKNTVSSNKKSCIAA